MTTVYQIVFQYYVSMSNINSRLGFTKALGLATILCLTSCGDQQAKVVPLSKESSEVKHVAVKEKSISEKATTNVKSDSLESVKEKSEAPKKSIKPTSKPKVQVKPKEKIKPKPKPKTMPKSKAETRPVSKPVRTKTKRIVKPAPKKIINTEMVFRRNFFNYDTITQGDTIRHSFKFTNIGEHDLFIKDVKVSCGCTFPYYPKEAIAPQREYRYRFQ